MSSLSISPGNAAYIFRSGVRAQVSPEGDCVEATFIARGDGLGLSPLQVTTIYISGTPIFRGEVRIGGNTSDTNGHQVTLRSLALRLKEVFLPPKWSAPQQNASTTIASIINSVSSQLGGSISLGTINANFTCREIVDANQQTPYALLEQIAQDGAAMGTDYRFGVNAYGQFFFVPRNTSTMLLSGNLTSNTRWTAPVAETPCTAVLWYLAKDGSGSWITHMSTSSNSSYGIRGKAVSLSSTHKLWKIAPYSTVTSDGVTTLINDATVTAALADEQPKYVFKTPTSGSGGLVVSGNVARISSDSESGSVYLEQTLSQGADYHFIDVVWTNGKPDQNRLIVSQPGLPQKIYTSTELKRQFWGAGTAGTVNVSGAGSMVKIELWNLKAGTTLRFEGASDPAATDVARRKVMMEVFESRPEMIDRSLLDNLAKFYYSIPSTTAGEIESTGLTSYLGGNSPWGPVAAIEYRVTAEKGVCTALRIGVPDEPNKVAQAELIKMRNDNSVITAITRLT